MAVAAMAVGATAKAARAVVEKVRDARTSRASNWRRVSLTNLSPEIAPRFARIELAPSDAVATWWHGPLIESGAE